MVPMVVCARADGSARGEECLRRGRDHAPVDLAVLRTGCEIAPDGPRSSWAHRRGRNRRPPGVSMPVRVLGAAPHHWFSAVCAWPGVAERFAAGASSAARDAKRLIFGQVSALGPAARLENRPVRARRPIARPVNGPERSCRPAAHQLRSCTIAAPVASVILAIEKPGHDDCQ